MRAVGSGAELRARGSRDAAWTAAAAASEGQALDGDDPAGRDTGFRQDNVLPRAILRYARARQPGHAADARARADPDSRVPDGTAAAGDRQHQHARLRARWIYRDGAECRLPDGRLLLPV